MIILQQQLENKTPKVILNMSFSFDVFKMTGNRNLHFPEGEYVLSQGWNSQIPSFQNKDVKESFTIHALYCSGFQFRTETFSKMFKKYSIFEIFEKRKEYAKENPSFLKDNSEDLLADMQKYWRSFDGKFLTFWKEECWKHCPIFIEKCTDDLEEEEVVECIFQYFNITMKMHKLLNTFSFLEDLDIYPSMEIAYTKDMVQDAILSRFGKSVNIRVGKHGSIYGVNYHFDLKNGKFQPKDAEKLFVNNNLGPLHLFPKFCSKLDQCFSLKKIPAGYIEVRSCDLSKRYGYVTKNGNCLKTSSAKAPKFFMYSDADGDYYFKAKSGYMNCSGITRILSCSNYLDPDDPVDEKMTYNPKNGRIGYDNTYTWFTDCYFSPFHSTNIFNGGKALLAKVHVQHKFNLVFVEV